MGAAHCETPMVRLEAAIASDYSIGEDNPP
jgi:hypothetical protein